ncbi:unnamed protein product, partial [Allacma fusca]
FTADVYPSIESHDNSLIGGISGRLEVGICLRVSMSGGRDAERFSMSRRLVSCPAIFPISEIPTCRVPISRRLVQQ